MNCGPILILGGNGMLGQSLCRTFAMTNINQVYTTIRQSNNISYDSQLKNINIIKDVDINNFDKISEVLVHVKPKFIINAIVQKGQAERDLSASIQVNALFPHKLYEACDGLLNDFYIIHISTDGVFSGKAGGYTENDTPDALDIYGLTKTAGELRYEHCVTIRTSIYGREKIGKTGLLEWFLNSGEFVEGFANMFFSGVSTDQLSLKIKEIILSKNRPRGILHYPGEKISKYELLQLFNKATGNQKTIKPITTTYKDLSLKTVCPKSGVYPSQKEMVSRLEL